MRFADDVIQIYQSMSALARDLSAVNLAQGVPEPVHDDAWRTALAEALPDTHFQYTQTRGRPDLREAVARVHGTTPERVVITSGCTESLVAALTGLADLGRRTVVWLEPYYSYYPGMAGIAGLSTRSVPLDLTGTAPRLDLDRLRDVLRPLGADAVLLLNSPHNPSGLVLTPPEWAAVAELAEETGCFVLLDDAYRDFRYGPALPPYADLLAGGRAAVAGSASKSFAATGIRLGWLIAPPVLDPIAESAHMHMSNCAPDLLQRAAVRVAARVTPDVADAVARRYRRKRDLLLAGLSATGLRTLTPDGGHFVMARPPSVAGVTAHEVAVGLARASGVVPLPLESFFDTPPDEPWLRFSFAVPEADLVRACACLTGGRAAMAGLEATA